MGTSWAKLNEVSLSLDLRLRTDDSTGGSLGVRETYFSVVVVVSGPVFCSMYCYQSFFPVSVGCFINQSSSMKGRQVFLHCSQCNLAVEFYI